jgi:hypothetical protein
MKAWRIILAVGGGLVASYGIIRLLVSLPPAMLLLLGIWLVAAILIHHGVLSPAVLAVGRLLRRFVPDRARTFVQAGLIMAAAVTVIGLPLAFRQFSRPPSKAMLLQHYGSNLILLLGGIAVGSLVAYAIRVAHDHRQPAGRNVEDE